MYVYTFGQQNLAVQKNEKPIKPDTRIVQAHHRSTQSG